MVVDESDGILLKGFNFVFGVYSRFNPPVRSFDPVLHARFEDGELFAFVKSDIDHGRRLVRVLRNVQRAQNGAIFRTVANDRKVEQLFAAHLRVKDETARILGIGTADDGEGANRVHFPQVILAGRTRFASFGALTVRRILTLKSIIEKYI